MKNRAALEVEEAVISYAVEYPAYGQLRASNELKKKGIFISPGGVRNVWLRHNLHNMKLRLRALEEKSAKEKFILTGSKALEKAKEEKVAYGEIETLFPGYLGAHSGIPLGDI